MATPNPMPVLSTDSRSSTARQHLVIARAGPVGQVPGERRDRRVSIAGAERNHDPVRRQQLGQEHGAAWRGMGQT